MLRHFTPAVLVQDWRGNRAGVCASVGRRRSHPQFSLASETSHGSGQRVNNAGIGFEIVGDLVQGAESLYEGLEIIVAAQDAAVEYRVDV